MLSLKAIGTVLCVLLPAAGAYAQVEEDLGTSSGPAEETAVVQQTCPVMAGNKLDLEIFTVYQGKKVYFCCQMCKSTFEQNPEKYVDGLPQFAAAESEIEQVQTDAAAKTEIERVQTAPAARRFLPARFIKPLGLTTAALLVMTACAGFFMPKRRKLLFKQHRWLAVATLIAALCHAALVILFR